MLVLLEQINMNNFLLENPIWKVVLSNNEIIISDNEYIDGLSDWLRLKKYCIDNKLNISEMYICFRDNCKKIPKGNMYYFRRMSLGKFGKNNRVSQTYQYFIVGSTNDPNKIHLYKYLVPEMENMEEEDRILDNEESLI